MAAINPLPDIFDWAYGVCRADPELLDAIPDADTPGEVRVYDGQVPQGSIQARDGSDARYPCIIVTIVLCPPIKAKRTGSRSIAWRPLLQIEAVGETESAATLGNLAGRIAALFDERVSHDTQGQIIIASSECEHVLAGPPEPVVGTIYRRLGGEYRQFCYAVP